MARVFVSAGRIEEAQNEFDQLLAASSEDPFGRMVGGVAFTSMMSSIVDEALVELADEALLEGPRGADRIAVVRGLIVATLSRVSVDPCPAHVNEHRCPRSIAGSNFRRRSPDLYGGPRQRRQLRGCNISGCDTLHLPTEVTPVSTLRDR
jgi:hypothetical protein